MTLKQVQFMRASRQSVNGVNFQQISLYKELIREELVNELFPALDAWMEDPLNRQKLLEVLDGLGDVEVVINGLAYSLGVELPVIKDRIDDSNLTKIKNGKVIKREDGKVMKPDTFKLPILADIVEDVLANMRIQEDAKDEEKP